MSFRLLTAALLCFICASPLLAMRRDDDKGAPPVVLEMVGRYLDALHRGAADDVTALLSPDAKKAFCFPAAAVAPFSQRTPEKVAARKAIFGTEDIKSLTDTEFVLRALRAKLRGQAALEEAEVRYAVLGGVICGGGYYVVVERTDPADPNGPAPFVLLVASSGPSTEGIGLDPRLWRIAQEIAEEI